MAGPIDVDSIRQPEHLSNAIFHRRWSPWAMSGESLSDAEISALFEAARWAPSCFTEQPWRLLYARRESRHWPKFFALMV